MKRRSEAKSGLSAMQREEVFRARSGDLENFAARGKMEQGAGAMTRRGTGRRTIWFYARFDFCFVGAVG